MLKYYIAYKKLIKIGLDLIGQILYTKSNNEITGKVMYNFAAPLFWYKFVFLAEIMIAEMLIVYRMKRKKHFVKRVFLALFCVVVLTFVLPVPFYNAVYSSFLFLIIFIYTLIALKFCFDEPWGNVVYCGFFSYHWLRLKHYFDIALPDEMTTLPDYQKEKMKKDGWMFPLNFINSRITVCGNVQVTTEELYIRHFDKFFDYLFTFNIGEENSRINRYYRQAIFNYKNKCYYSCAVSLFPIIESYHQYMTNFHENKFYRIKDNLGKIGDKIENVNQIYDINITYYINLVKQFNDLAKNHYFNSSLDRKNEPEIINRNRIMHGVFSREISKKDCLQLFCVISNMIVIKNIIDANDSMDEIEEELKMLHSEEC